MTTPPEKLTTNREAPAALGAFAPVTLSIACSQLGIRPLSELQPDTSLHDDEATRLTRVLNLLHAATDGTREGYIGVLWAMESNPELDGCTPIEACQERASGEAAMAALKRRQDRLFGR